MPKSVDITMPDFEGTESVVAAWLVEVGERVAEHAPIAEISTDKVTVEVPSPADGVLLEILKAPDTPVVPGDVLGRIGAGAPEPTSSSAGGNGRTAPASPRAAARVATAQSPATSRGPMSERLSPAVRRAVREYGLDVAAIAGTGRGGRITFRDVETHLASDRANLPPAPATPSRADSTPALRAERIAHSPMRKGIAEHMVRSFFTAPHVTAVMEADLTRVIAHRAASKPAFEAEGIRLTLTAYFVQAAVEALRHVPDANARWHDDAVERMGSAHVGIATAVEAGLIVPVIRDAQDLDLRGIARALTDLTGRARDGRLSPGDVQGGTFTITNHGGGGSLIATPIINQPQSAILGVGKVEKRVVVREVDGTDAILIRPMTYLTVTIDHRVLDGYQANQFLGRVVEVLESWDR